MPQTIEAVDLIAWRRMRDLFPDDQLQSYWGKQVAWSADGSRILASAETGLELHRLLVSRGLAGHEYVLEFIEDPNVRYF